MAWLAEKAGLDPWEYQDRVLARLHHEHHCNMIWVVNIGTDDLIRLCGLAAKHDMVVVGTPEPVIWWRQNRTPEFALKCAEESVKRLAEVEGFGGYVLIDEPRAWELSYLDAIRAELERLDPQHPTIMVTMRGDTPAAIARTNFGIITSDIYPFFADGSPNGPNPAPVSRAYYRLCAQAFGEQCQARGKTFWMMPQCYNEIWGDWHYGADGHCVAQPGCYLHWRTPTVGEMRWQTWEAVANGARGVVYFVLFPPGNDRTADSPPGQPQDNPFPKTTETVDTGQPAALLNADSSATPQLTAMGEDFAALQELAPLLQGLRLSPFPIAFAQPPLHARTLRDGAGNLYAAVVNDNTDAPTTGEVALLPGLSGLRDLKREADTALTSGDDALLRASIELAPGEGTLLQLVAEPGRRPVATCVEDFTTPLITGRLEGGEVRARVLGWGVGWEYEVVQTADGNPATLTCDIATLTGDPKVHRPSGPIFLVYEGRAAGEGSGVEVSFSTDGESFATVGTDQFGVPVVIPNGASDVRFTVSNGGALAQFSGIATEK
ncbi:MAG: hypothetical protein FJX74_04510 [Armatimonadetes bacterium]|nr:hypothetical protein [Armatimonadota bacterium]